MELRRYCHRPAHAVPHRAPNPRRCVKNSEGTSDVFLPPDGPVSRSAGALSRCIVVAAGNDDRETAGQAIGHIKQRLSHPEIGPATRFELAGFTDHCSMWADDPGRQFRLTRAFGSDTRMITGPTISLLSSGHARSSARSMKYASAGPTLWDGSVSANANSGPS